MMIRILLCLFLSISSAKATDYYAINGVNVGVFSDTKMVIEPFSLWMWDGSASFNGQTIGFTQTKYPDLTTVGCNGMDALQSGQSSGAMPPDGTYKLFAFYNPTTFDTCFITTGAIAYSDIVKPSGYNYWRPIMYGVTVYQGKLLENHVSHWPMPRIDFTQQIQVGPAFTTSVTDYCINIHKLIPENARFANFRAVLTGAGNNLWLSPSAGTAYRKLFAYNGQDVKPNLWTRVQRINNTTTCVYVTFQPGSNGRLDLYMDGYNVTEVN